MGQQLPDPQKGRTVDLAHLKRHQSVLIERHVFLLVRVKNLQHLLQQAVFSALVEPFDRVAEFKKLLFGWAFVEVYQNGLDCLLVALFAALELHGLLVDVGLRVGSVLLHLGLVVF